jgi:hypothetical protein
LKGAEILYEQKMMSDANRLKMKKVKNYDLEKETYLQHA